jgi:hypothetical protein
MVCLPIDPFKDNPMRRNSTFGLLLAAALLVFSTWIIAAPEDPKKPPESKVLIVVDAAGKEQKIRSWKFTAGTKRLAWLAPASKSPPKESDDSKPAEKPKPTPAGPEALVIREGSKFALEEGVLTFIPLERLRAVEFDTEEKTMTAKVAVSAKPEDDLSLTGTTKYARINKLALEADVDKGEDGVASIALQGGGLRNGIKAVRFPAPKASPPAKAGRNAVVETADKDEKQSHKVTDLLALYRLADGTEKLLPTLMFKKTLKVDLTKAKKIVGSTEESDDVVWQVTAKDEELSLTLMEAMPLDGKSAKLLGLLGRAPAGFKFFPVRSITEINFDVKEEAPKEKE